MSTKVLRLFWSVVSEIPSDKAAELSDDALIGSLLLQMNSRLCLSREEQTAVRSYFKTRGLLVREILQEAI